MFLLKKMKRILSYRFFQTKVKRKIRLSVLYCLQRQNGLSAARGCLFQFGKKLVGKRGQSIPVNGRCLDTSSKFEIQFALQIFNLLEDLL